MVNLIAINFKQMKKNKEELVVEPIAERKFDGKIGYLSLDFTREDLNNLAKKINEVITVVNEKLY